MNDVLSREELKIFCDAFFLFDEDKSGSITCDEVETAFEKMQISKEASKEFMKKLDQDGNGQVDFLEFVTFMIDGQAVTSNDQKELNSNPSVNESSDDVCTAAFSIFDADKDGLISPSDLRQALQKFGMNLTEDEAKEIIVSNSSISDNHLSYLEFYKIMQEYSAIGKK